MRDDLERRIAELASYHVGLFAGAASRLDDTIEVPALVAHALWLLSQEAKRRSAEWQRGPKHDPAG